MYFLSIDKILDINQIKRKYKIDILTSIKKYNFNYQGLKSILLYKLNKKGKNAVIFSSSSDKINYEKYIYKLKESFEEDNMHSAVVVTSKNFYSNKQDEFFYDNNMNNEEKEKFWLNLKTYDYIFIQSGSILTTNITKELIIKQKSIVLTEKCGISKFNSIDKTIEEITMFDGQIEGFIIFE